MHIQSGGGPASRLRERIRNYNWAPWWSHGLTACDGRGCPGSGRVPECSGHRIPATEWTPKNAGSLLEKTSDRMRQPAAVGSSNGSRDEKLKTHVVEILRANPTYRYRRLGPDWRRPQANRSTTSSFGAFSRHGILGSGTPRLSPGPARSATS